MRRERLKDQIEDPRVSLFDTLVRALVILISLGAVYYAFSGRGFPKPSAKREPAGSVAANAEVTLTATRDHRFYWNQSGPFPLAEAGPRLEAWRKTGATGRVIIAADENALLGEAIGLYNEARRLGVADVRLETRTRPTP